MIENKMVTATISALIITVFCSGCVTDATNESVNIETGQASYDSGLNNVEAGPPALQLTSTTPPSNLLVISVDTIRADFVYGEIENVELPFIHELMANGFVLKDHQSCSNWTLPSFYCMLTGRSTTEIGYHPTARNHNELPDTEYTLGERMADAGFSTSIVTSNPLMTLPSGVTEGYEKRTFSPAATATEITDEALELFETIDESSWVSHIHYFDPHSEYNPPEEFLVGVDDLVPTGLDVRDIYDISQLRGMEDNLSPREAAALQAQLYTYYAGELRYLDSELRRLFTELEAAGRLDNTLVMFIGDHGEQLLDHGKTQHGRDLFQEETRVPAFFWMKDGGVEAGESNIHTTHVDILPTLMEAMNLEFLSPDIPLSGTVIGTSSPDKTLISIHAIERGSAVRARHMNHELIFRFSSEIELYDIDENHLESDDLYRIDHPYIDELLGDAEEAVDLLLSITSITGPTR